VDVDNDDDDNDNNNNNNLFSVPPILHTRFFETTLGLTPDKHCCIPPAINYVYFYIYTRIFTVFNHSCFTLSSRCLTNTLFLKINVVQ
jgi:hypothetical protein